MDPLATAYALIAAGRPRAAARCLVGQDSPQVNGLLQSLIPDGPGGWLLAERLRFGPPETWAAWRGDCGWAALKLAGGCDFTARAAFRHPGVAPLLRHGDDWMAHAWIVGPTLASILRQGPPSPGLVDAVVEAVAALHAAGLAHGDVTPANVVVAADGPVLIDWGDDCAGTPGWRPKGEPSPVQRDLFALARLRALVGSHPILPR